MPEKNEKRFLFNLVSLVRSGDAEDSHVENALFDLCGDLGYVDVLCRLLTPEQVASLDTEGKLWP